MNSIKMTSFDDTSITIPDVIEESNHEKENIDDNNDKFSKR